MKEVAIMAPSMLRFNSKKKLEMKFLSYFDHFVLSFSSFPRPSSYCCFKFTWKKVNTSSKKKKVILHQGIQRKH